MEGVCEISLKGKCALRTQGSVTGTRKNFLGSLEPTHEKSSNDHPEFQSPSEEINRRWAIIEIAVLAGQSFKTEHT